MDLYFYNTRTRKKEKFIPSYPPQVGLYSCGPTVYDYAHIGNLRTYIFNDILRRVLEYNGWRVRHVMNITDVGHLVSDADEGEDKILLGARREKKSPYEIAYYYTEKFFEHTKKLNILKPHITCRATEHIQEMVEFVETLVARGLAYETSDGIYFSIEKFPGYGKLSGLNLNEQREGARVEVNLEKEHPADFALWKKAPKNHIMQWESPWGMGFPGWHLECSAMGLKYLGEYFDIHTGGVDHIPIHHENEIAQNWGYKGREVIRYWLHAEFLQVDGGKMSKSLGNVYNMHDLEEKGFEPLAFRYLTLNAHYRKLMNFTWEAMDGAQKALNRLRAGIERFRQTDRDHHGREKFTHYQQEFKEALNDDLNLPRAMAILWDIVRGEDVSKEAYELIMGMDTIFGLDLQGIEKEKEKEELPDWIHRLIEKREEARRQKDWGTADSIRDELAREGIKLIDTPEGVEWEYAEKTR